MDRRCAWSARPRVVARPRSPLCCARHGPSFCPPVASRGPRRCREWGRGHRSHLYRHRCRARLSHPPQKPQPVQPALPLDTDRQARVQSQKDFRAKAHHRHSALSVEVASTPIRKAAFNRTIIGDDGDDPNHDVMFVTRKAKRMDMPQPLLDRMGDHSASKLYRGEKADRRPATSSQAYLGHGLKVASLFLTDEGVARPDRITTPARAGVRRSRRRRSPTSSRSAAGATISSKAGREDLVAADHLGDFPRVRRFPATALTRSRTRSRPSPASPGLEVGGDIADHRGGHHRPRKGPSKTTRHWRRHA